MAIFLLTSIKALQLGTFFGLTFPSRAARYLAPVGLLMLLEWKQSNGQKWEPSAIFNMLRIAIALTFFGHGVKVLFHSSSFLHLISASELNILGTTLLSPEATFLILDVIAIVDLIVVVLIVGTRWQFIPIYMALWTFMTASSRVLANGPVSWDDIVIRASYYGIPLAILCFYHWQNEQKPQEQKLPANKHTAFGRSFSTVP